MDYEIVYSIWKHIAALTGGDRNNESIANVKKFFCQNQKNFLGSRSETINRTYVRCGATVGSQ
jgi:hypothetical protein